MSESGNCTSIINLTYQDGSEGSPSNPVKFNNQDYAQLKDSCRSRGRLFLDSTFPPENRSLGDLPDLNSWEEAQVEWLRPAVKYIFSPCLYIMIKISCAYINICIFAHFRNTYFYIVNIAFFFYVFALICWSTSYIFPLLYCPGHLESTKQQRWACFLYVWALTVWLRSRRSG